MEKYDVVIIIIGLLTTAITIGAPVIKLNRTITELIIKLDILNRDVVEMADHNHEAYKRIWANLGDHDRKLSDHECRLKIIEQKED